jgi:hypothetical protein
MMHLLGQNDVEMMAHGGTACSAAEMPLCDDRAL